MSVVKTVLTRASGSRPVPRASLSLGNRTNSMRDIPPFASSAQMCNCDVLSIIFSMLRNCDRFSAALTCTYWSPAALDSLYRRLEFTWREDEDGIPDESQSLLAETLMSCESARRRIRHLTIQNYMLKAPSTSSPFDWLLLLPRSVISFNVYLSEFVSKLVIDTILRADFLSGVRAYDQCPGIDALGERNRLSLLLKCMPNLRSLSIPLRRSIHHEIPLFAAGELQRLCICLDDCSDAVAALLRLVAPTLRVLEIDLDQPQEYYDRLSRSYEDIPMIEARELFERLLLPMPRLEELSICLQPPLPITFIPANFSLRSHYPLLKTLYFNADGEVPNVLRDLPTGLETLALGTAHHTLFPYDDLVSFLNTFPHHNPAFGELFLYLLDPLDPVKKACKASGVKLFTPPSDGPLSISNLYRDDKFVVAL